MNARTLQRFCTDVPMISDWVITAMMMPVSLLPDATEIRLAEHPYYKQLREQCKPKMSVRDDGVAIVPIQGVLARNPSPYEMMFDGVEDSVAVLDMVQSAAANPEVRGVLFNIDSPGGFMTGGPEIADAVRAMAKPNVAYIGGDGASLAYWIGSQAGEVIASRSANVGSIGGYVAHIDRSKFLESLGVKVEVIRNK